MCVSTEFRRKMILQIIEALKESPVFRNISIDQIKEAVLNSEHQTFQQSKSKEEYIYYINEKLKKIQKNSEYITERQDLCKINKVDSNKTDCTAGSFDYEKSKIINGKIPSHVNISQMYSQEQPQQLNNMSRKMETFGSNFDQCKRNKENCFEKLNFQNNGYHESMYPPTNYSGSNYSQGNYNMQSFNSQDYYKVPQKSFQEQQQFTNDSISQNKYQSNQYNFNQKPFLSNQSNYSYSNSNQQNFPSNYIQAKHPQNNFVQQGQQHPISQFNGLQNMKNNQSQIYNQNGYHFQQNNISANTGYANNINNRMAPNFQYANKTYQVPINMANPENELFEKNKMYQSNAFKNSINTNINQVINRSPGFQSTQQYAKPQFASFSPFVNQDRQSFQHNVKEIDPRMNAFMNRTHSESYQPNIRRDNENIKRDSDLFKREGELNGIANTFNKNQTVNFDDHSQFMEANNIVAQHSFLKSNEDAKTKEDLLFTLQNAYSQKLNKNETLGTFNGYDLNESVNNNNSEIKFNENAISNNSKNFRNDALNNNKSFIGNVNPSIFEANSQKKTKDFLFDDKKSEELFKSIGEEFAKTGRLKNIKNNMFDIKKDIFLDKKSDIDTSILTGFNYNKLNNTLNTCLVNGIDTDTTEDQINNVNAPNNKLCDANINKITNVCHSNFKNSLELANNDISNEINAKANSEIGYDKKYLTGMNWAAKTISINNSQESSENSINDYEENDSELNDSTDIKEFCNANQGSNNALSMPCNKSSEIRTNKSNIEDNSFISLCTKNLQTPSRNSFNNDINNFNKNLQDSFKYENTKQNNVVNVSYNTNMYQLKDQSENNDLSNEIFEKCSNNGKVYHSFNAKIKEEQLDNKNSAFYDKNNLVESLNDFNKNANLNGRNGIINEIKSIESNCTSNKTNEKLISEIFNNADSNFQGIEKFKNDESFNKNNLYDESKNSDDFLNYETSNKFIDCFTETKFNDSQIEIDKSKTKHVLGSVLYSNDANYKPFNVKNEFKGQNDNNVNSMCNNNVKNKNLNTLENNSFVDNLNYKSNFYLNENSNVKDSITDNLFNEELKINYNSSNINSHIDSTLNNFLDSTTLFTFKPVNDDISTSENSELEIPDELSEFLQENLLTLKEIDNEKVWLDLFNNLLQKLQNDDKVQMHSFSKLIEMQSKFINFYFLDENDLNAYLKICSNPINTINYDEKINEQFTENNEINKQSI